MAAGLVQRGQGFAAELLDARPVLGLHHVAGQHPAAADAQQVGLLEIVLHIARVDATGGAELEFGEGTGERLERIHAAIDVAGNSLKRR